MKNIKLMLEYSKNLNVLYVEDDTSLLKITSKLLSNYFNSVETACNGQEGLDKYREYYAHNDEYYDLVITDINMPKLNGIDMSKEILKENSLQSIVITTAHNEMEFLTKAIEVGVDGFVTKPIKNEQLIKVLHKASRIVSEHKFVDKHIESVESLNIDLDLKNKFLQEQNKELSEINRELKKSSRMLDTIAHKKEISRLKPSTKKESINANIPDKYMQEQIKDLINEDLWELREMHQDIDLNIISILDRDGDVDADNLSSLVDKFSKYASILTAYNFFDKLGASMKSFVTTINNSSLPNNENTITNIFLLLEGFMYVLGKWQDDLSLGNAESINTSDASMISDMHTITNMWTQTEEEVSDENLDGIFDF